MRLSSRFGPEVLRSVLIFGLCSLALLTVVTAVMVVLVVDTARDAQLRDARRHAQHIALHDVAPLVDARFRAREPSAVAALDQVLRSRFRDGSIVRMKLWNEDGVIMWSDDKRLVGKSFALEPEVRRLLGSGGSLAQVSDLSQEENALESSAGTLGEVYVAVEAADSRPLLFEVYLDTESIEEDTRALVSSVVPIAVGALLVFQLAVLPLSVSLARRVDRAQEEHLRLARQAAVATELERRRVAQHLHDGVIQDLAGLGYVLSGTPARRHAKDRYHVDDAVRTAKDVVQRDVQALRSLLTDLYQPDLEGDGLVHAVEDVVAQLRQGGVQVTCETRLARAVPQNAAMLAYRIVREGLRNVAHHSRAEHAYVRLSTDESQLQVRITDDGCGIDLDSVDNYGSCGQHVPAEEGHLGLRLLSDGVRDAGGSFELRSAPGRGTTLSATVPLAAQPPAALRR